jgi:outer membrane protein assembly factor BamB
VAVQKRSHGRFTPCHRPDGTIYVGAHEGLLALSPGGRLLWQAGIGEAGTPVISEDGTIYLDTWHGFLFGASKDGQLIWRPGYGLIGFNAPPALGANTTLFCLNNVSDIYVFRPKQGNEKLWSLDTFREGILGAETVLPGSTRVGVISTKAAPILTPIDSVILPRQNFLHSVSTGGTPEWELELSPGSLGQAALAEDGTIYVGDDRSILYAVDSSGTKKWRFERYCRCCLFHGGRRRVCRGSRWQPEVEIFAVTTLGPLDITGAGSRRHAVCRRRFRVDRAQPGWHPAVEFTHLLAHVLTNHRT